jgi:hypothetical protein
VAEDLVGIAHKSGQQLALFRCKMDEAVAVLQLPGCQVQAQAINGEDLRRLGLLLFPLAHRALPFSLTPRCYYTIDRQAGKRLGPFNLKIPDLFHSVIFFTNRGQAELTAFMILWHNGNIAVTDVPGRREAYDRTRRRCPFRQARPAGDGGLFEFCALCAAACTPRDAPAASGRRRAAVGPARRQRLLG